MTKKVLVIGNAHDHSDQLLVHKLKYEHGKDVIVFSLEEAREKGINIDGFCNEMAMKIIDLPIIPIVEFGDYKSGKESRRERRAKERKQTKLRQAPVINQVCGLCKGEKWIDEKKN